MEKPLSNKERTRFEELIGTVKDAAERDVHARLEMGVAMLEIRDSHLYREDYDTFEELCLDVWGYGRSYAYQLIDFNVIRRQLEGQGVKVLPTNEYQIRPLKRLKAPEERALAWENAVEMSAAADKSDAPPSQSIVKRAVEAKLYALKPATKRDDPLPKPTKPQPAEARPFVPDLISEDATIVDMPLQAEATPAPVQPALDGPVILDHVQCPVCQSIYKLLEEYMTAAEEIPQGNQLNGKAKNAIRGQLEQHFSKISNIPMPLPKTEKQKSEARVRWWTPLRTIAELANWNQAEAERLIEDAFKLLRSKGFLIEAPQSILKTVTALAAGQTAGKPTALDLLKQDFQQNEAEIEEARRAS